MTIRTWNPFRELDVLRQEVERAFDTYGRPWRQGSALRAVPLHYPLLNVSEDKDNVYVEALAPGIDPETLDVTVVRDTLRIAGEKQALSDEIKPEAYHRNERSAGKFVRTLTLPVEVDGESVTAEYRNGVLHITLAKVEAAKPKQIEVAVS
ncbi:MAG: Hsp20 family protein [Nitrospiraceae bacterium]|nr:Hsp20 family protein [Nitrospiraceae bacterium]